MSKGVMKKKLNEIKSFCEDFWRARKKEEVAPKCSINSQHALLEGSACARVQLRHKTNDERRCVQDRQVRGYYGGTRASVGPKVLNWQRRAAPFC